MKTHLQALMTQALEALLRDGLLAGEPPTDIPLERARDRTHGDFASAIALMLAKTARRKPRELAERIVAALPESDRVANVEIAGPGFINFFLTPTAYHGILADILEQGDAFGRGSLGAGRRVQVEFVSANPTGPLHVGHGRGAAFGATVANLLDAIGYQVHREYYVNDAGRQMNILAVSIWLRYLEHCGERLTFPSNGYRGDYVREIATRIYAEHGGAYVLPSARVFQGLPADETQDEAGHQVAGGDKETYIDALVERARTLLGERRYGFIFDLGLKTILADIRDDLRDFGVVYEHWYSERTLEHSGVVDQSLERLRAAGYLYEQEGALWFRSSAFGDEKDRVVRRENGQTTYFASDIAYHLEKFERGFDWVIDVWGADHHGYVPRIKATLQALGENPDRLAVLLVQFAILYRNGERAPMSTRSGEFVTLRELRREIGNDAARFFYVMRKSEQHLDFDLDLAKSQSKDNPVYYIQYAHARVCSVLRQLREKGLSRDEARGNANLGLLVEPHEELLLVALSRYPEVVEAAALAHEPHQLAHYLRELANAFHTYYNEHRVLVTDDALRDARLNLSVATRQIIKNGLSLLGVSAPEVM
ncbi:MAG: arginine--tRNA ligase [Candidatus Competibacteraceae bacterium]|nr:arginine--tRNA ligase [Candidatus Competibacteraceae bacterium]MBK7983713.1 arginine--tRNA ligase [Candidatus Competibacteraceae bacterium]MBK8897745.1 arginine--tRNA ligase [Candidatus Competibacteraceae bacterium]MBK8961550.1 arginine--tRNA ligase [Candidatus Competibacteraceae bacterium]MBK9950776.1 arginine--tRNA ligase [Candidatus Competibacteraceae bacterium]